MNIAAPTPTILEALRDPQLLGGLFKNAVTWQAWLTILGATFGLPPEDPALFAKVAGGRRAPEVPPHLVWWVKGRRGGGSFVAAAVAVYLGALRDYREHLGPGEVATVMLIAADRKQARVLLRYVRGILEASPLLREKVARIYAEGVMLDNGVAIEVHTASFRTVRGYTVVAAILDEIAFWPVDEEAAEPDREIIAALLPAMATIPGALLLGLSSPYGRRGVLWDAFQASFGNDDPEVLVIQGDTLTLNPTVPRSVIDAAYERDPIAAAAEYGAQFRNDISGAFDPALIDRAVNPERPPELPPRSNTQYVPASDPSGGRGDSFTFAIAHAEESRVILDVVRATRPPFDPAVVVKEYAALAKLYGCQIIEGDRYAGEWVVAAFRAEGITYIPAPRTASDTYLELGPLLAQGRVELPDDRLLLTELRGLLRRTRSGGRDLITHPPRAHDDAANAAALAIVATARRGVAENVDDAKVVGESVTESFDSPFAGVDHDSTWAESPWSNG